MLPSDFHLALGVAANHESFVDALRSKLKFLWALLGAAWLRLDTPPRDALAEQCQGGFFGQKPNDVFHAGITHHKRSCGDFACLRNFSLQLLLSLVGLGDRLFVSLRVPRLRRGER